MRRSLCCADHHGIRAGDAGCVDRAEHQPDSADEAGSVKFARHRRHRHGRQPPARGREAADRARAQFPFDFVIMNGDNLYGGNSAKDYDRKFALPYKPLLDGGVNSTRRSGTMTSKRAVLQAVQHERRALLHVQAAEFQRAVLRSK